MTPRVVPIAAAAALVILASCERSSEAARTPTPAVVSIDAGNAQTTSVGTPVPVNPRILVLDAQGNPAPGVDVTFGVVAGAGSVSDRIARTGIDGVAAVSWTLGHAPGANALRAVVSGSAAVTFDAIAVAGPPAIVSKDAGDAQVAGPGSAVAVAPVVLVADRFGNPLASVAVEFVVNEGGGTVWRASATTDERGRASCERWKLGKGTGRNALSATVSGLVPAGGIL